MHRRSALVIGVAAAEVGFKRLVGSLVPQAQWLMDEVQTPSLAKMLASFFRHSQSKLGSRVNPFDRPTFFLTNWIKLSSAVGTQGMVSLRVPPAGVHPVVVCGTCRGRALDVTANLTVADPRRRSAGIFSLRLLDTSCWSNGGEVR